MRNWYKKTQLNNKIKNFIKEDEFCQKLFAVFNICCT